MSAYIYILQSQSTGRYYIGQSLDPQARIAQHNANGTTSTRYKGPWLLRFSQSFATREEAIRMESWLKRSKSRTLVEQIIREGSIRKRF